MNCRRRCLCPGLQSLLSVAKALFCLFSLHCSMNNVEVPRGAFSTAQPLRLERWAAADCQRLLENLGSSIYGTGRTISDCLGIFPETQLVSSTNTSMMVSLMLNDTNMASKIRVSLSDEALCVLLFFVSKWPAWVRMFCALKPATVPI